MNEEDNVEKTTEKNEENKQNLEQKKPKYLATKETGLLKLDKLEDQLHYAHALMKQGLISTSFQTPQQVVTAIQWAISIRMEPTAALRMMYVVNGRPCLWGDGPLALVQRSSLVSQFKEFWIDENGEVISFKNKNLNSKFYASVVLVGREGDEEIQEDFFTLDDLQTAGLNVNKYGNQKDVWKKFERIMMRYKARTMALKSKFADLINGMDIAEYHHHVHPGDIGGLHNGREFLEGKTENAKSVEETIQKEMFAREENDEQLG